jgi:hypothetical protein
VLCRVRLLGWSAIEGMEVAKGERWCYKRDGAAPRAEAGVYTTVRHLKHYFPVGNVVLVYTVIILSPLGIAEGVIVGSLRVIPYPSQFIAYSMPIQSDLCTPACSMCYIT